MIMSVTVVDCLKISEEASNNCYKSTRTIPCKTEVKLYLTTYLRFVCHGVFTENHGWLNVLFRLWSTPLIVETNLAQVFTYTFSRLNHLGQNHRQYLQQK